MPSAKPANRRNVPIDRLPIELYKLLKFENLVQSGGEAKMLISAGMVKVNGEVETRKSKKIVAGDIVRLGDYELIIEQAPQG